MIAKAFARKKNQKEGGEEEEEDNVSLSFESASHDDAIGKYFTEVRPLSPTGVPSRLFRGKNLKYDKNVGNVQAHGWWVRGGGGSKK